MILLDTQVMLWLRLGDPRLGPGARRGIDQAWHSAGVGVSAISFWEVAMLKDKGRIVFPEDVGLWRREQLGQGVVEIPVDGEIGIRAVNLVDFHPDPADRLIVATALGGHQLIPRTGGFSTGPARWGGWTQPSEDELCALKTLENSCPQRAAFRRRRTANSYLRWRPRQDSNPRPAA